MIGTDGNEPYHAGGEYGRGGRIGADNQGSRRAEDGVEKRRNQDRVTARDHRHARADIVDPALDRQIPVAHQCHHRPVTASEPFCLGLAEVRIDPVTVAVDQRQRRLVGHGPASRTQLQIGDIAIDRGVDLGELEIPLRLFHCGPGGTQLGIFLTSGAEGGLHLGQIRLGLQAAALGPEQGGIGLVLVGDCDQGTGPPIVKVLSRNGAVRDQLLVAFNRSGRVLELSRRAGGD